MTDSPEYIPIKEIITAASPFIKSVVDTFITPKLEKFKKRFSSDYNTYYIPTEEHFSEYFHRTYKRISIINTLVFNNSQKLLKDIYLPLTLINQRQKFKISEYPSNLINNYEKVLITDNAGMGKSTLIKKIFLDTIDSKNGVPILIELRRLSKEKKIINEIHEQINALNKDFDKSLLLELLQEGGFIILLDGYDEISLSDRENVTKDLQTFIEKSSKNKFILTSRPESALKSFGDFQEFKIEPLKKKEAFELLRKYDNQGSISTLLIKKLEELDLANIDEFLTNPLLVSLLFTAFQHKQSIPFKKYIFYRQVYDANFESHDLTKGDSYTHDKYSKLEIDDFHRILRHIGYSCLKDNQRIEFTKDELLNLIKQAKGFCVDLKFTESDFMKDILSTVPLFSQDGNYYRWVHKSLQEYFAAQFIYLDAKEQQKKIIHQIFNNKSIDKFINIIDLYYDIDPKSFRHNILLALLTDFENHINSTFIEIDANISEDDITLRKELTFLSKPFLFSITNYDETSLDHKRLDDMLQNQVTGSRVSGSLSSPNYDKELFCLLKAEPKLDILKLLQSRIPNLFKEVKNKKSEEINVNIVHNLEKDFKPYFLNDSANDIFNLVTNFNQVNKLIIHSILENHVINSKEALILLSELRSQVENENHENFLLDGIQ